MIVKSAWAQLLAGSLRDDYNMVCAVAYKDNRMIPKAQFRRAVERFERATRCLRCARAAGPRERANILFEYRDAKRSLLDLGSLLITGEMPMKSLGPDKNSSAAGEQKVVRYPAPSFGKGAPKHPY